MDVDLDVDDLSPGNLPVEEDGHCAGNQEYTCDLYHQPSIISTFLHVTKLMNACTPIDISQSSWTLPRILCESRSGPNTFFKLSDINRRSLRFIIGCLSGRAALTAIRPCCQHWDGQLHPRHHRHCHHCHHHH